MLLITRILIQNEIFFPFPSYKQVDGKRHIQTGNLRYAKYAVSFWNVSEISLAQR